jgi:MoaA/NifB/PqqE/SkfB family radical SAM enzyme
MAEAGDLPSGYREKLWLYINFDCNLACSYCVAGSGPRTSRPRMELDAMAMLVDEAVALGFRQVVVTGGEPMLHPKLLPMLDYATSRIDTLLLTNAMLATTRSFRGLRERRDSRLAVQVSLDSADPRLHDRWRGKGSWRQAVDGLTTLLDWGFPVSVRATFTEQSDAEVEEWGRFLERLGVRKERIFGEPVAKGGRSRDGLDLGRADLHVEPTVAADGLYRHPLKVDQTLVAAKTALPLRSALDLLAAEDGDQAPSAARCYR